jgi:SAM-dependent methyltransferase
MSNIFENSGMAAGYATSRPPVHPRIVDRIARTLHLAERVECALDVGCGAGLSTRPLHKIANRCVGIEPVEAMLKFAADVAPRAGFAVGRAEALPVRSHTVDLITAAGSLNYADLRCFFPEAARVLRPNGSLIVYDFSQGKTLRDSPDLDSWHTGFRRRYPQPASHARELSPEILASLDSGFKLTGHELFEIGIVLSPAFYLDYTLTETNVANAVRSGIPQQEIRDWCAETLSPVFRGESKEVLFRGYIAYLALN